MKLFIRKHQIVIFFILSILLSWFPWYTGRSAEVLAVGPSLAAFLLVIILQGKSGVLDLLRPFGRWRSRMWLWCIALLGPAALYMIGLGLHLALGGDAPPFTMIKNELNLVPLYLVMVVLLPWNGPVGEEFGWRGYALPRLQQRLGPLLASLILGTLWGVWHLPSFFNPLGVTGALATSYGTGLFLIIYTSGTIANTVLMTWLYNRSGSSALLAGILWHAAINFWAPVLLSDSSLVAAREGSHLPTIVPNIYLAAIVAQILAAAILIAVTKGKLAYGTLLMPRKKRTRTRRLA